MKLYHAPGTCSFAPLIVAREAGLALDLERVDIARMPRRTETGADYLAINPAGYVPALALDDGAVVTEGTAILQHLADLAPGSGLAPPAGSIERVRLQSWLGFVSSELHKAYSPWLFHPEVGERAQDYARAKLAERLAQVDRHLGAGGPHLMGEAFTVADAYLFTIVGWSDFAKVDLSAFPHLRTFMDAVGARAAVRSARAAERGARAA